MTLILSFHSHEPTCGMINEFKMLQLCLRLLCLVILVSCPMLSRHLKPCEVSVGSRPQRLQVRIPNTRTVSLV